MAFSRKTFFVGATLASVVLLPAAAGAKETNNARLLVFYKTPTDETAFEKYYFGTHAPLASKLPGLRSYVVSKSPVFTPDGKPSATYSFFAELTFDSVDAIKAALGSPQGGVVVGDLKNFAQAGADITMCDVKSV
jgi:uncharacterized protein (TIGR02118 family)